MATKRGESRLELTDFSRKENDYIEKKVLPTDTLQGIALLYNTTVADLKKINHLVTDLELHAHRTIKVPSRGILINLEPEPDTVPILVPSNDEDEDEEEPEANGQKYLSNIDNSLKEIREKAETVTANSVVTNLDTPLHIRKVPNRSHGDVKWWKVFLPCLGTLIVFPILYFYYRKHLPYNNEETHVIND